MFQPIRLLHRDGSNDMFLVASTWCMAAVATFAALPAAAQELDYGKYESLFGESVTMSATGKPERISDTPILMDVITAEDISRSGARDIPTLLHRLAGVDLTHASTSSQELGIGGYLQAIGSRVMVLINGRQVYFDGFGDVFWSAVPVELQEIRQIEVIHGPESALYGFNAVDGVINIVTFDPVDDPVNAATARLGNHARRDVTASVTQSLGDGAGVRLSAASDHAHDYGMIQTTPSDAAYEKDPNRRSASFNAGFTLPDGARLGLEASHTDVTERAVVYDVFYDARVMVDSLKASYTANTGLGHINATGYYTGMQAPWVQTPAFRPFGVADRSAVGQVSDVFKAGSSDSVRLAGEVRHDEMSAGSLTDGTLAGDLGAGSAMWEHSFAPGLTSVNAVRYDYFKLGRSGPALPLNLYTNTDFDRSVQGFSANSAIIDKIGQADTLRLSFARGLKLPSLADFGQVEQFQYYPLYHFGNPDLVPSAIYDYQAGWDHHIALWDATNRLSVFHQMTMHHIGGAYVLFPAAVVQESTMGAGSVANGIEWALQHKAKEGWTWGVNYTFERLHEHADLGFQDAVPLHKANADIGYAWKAWDADLTAGYASATKGTIISGMATTPTYVTERIKNYATLSPRLAWHGLDPVTIELVADSLWPYRDSVAQRMEATYFLSVKISY
jgi:iron complex outermembrane receptor protein